MGEHRLCKPGVGGSIPLVSIELRIERSIYLAEKIETGLELGGEGDITNACRAGASKGKSLGKADGKKRLGKSLQLFKEPPLPASWPSIYSLFPTAADPSSVRWGQVSWGRIRPRSGEQPALGFSNSTSAYLADSDRGVFRGLLCRDCSLTIWLW